MTDMLRNRIRTVKQTVEVNAFKFGIAFGQRLLQQITAADQILEPGNAEACHDLADFFSNKEEIIHNARGLTLKALSEFRILCSDTDRAGVEMALTHHQTALHHQRCRCKAEFIGPEKRSDHHVAPGLYLTVDLHNHAVAQMIEHERLLRLRQTEFPGAARVLNRRNGACPRAAVVAGDHDVIGLGFGHTRRHRTHAVFAYELDGNICPAVGVFQIVDKLR